MRLITYPRASEHAWLWLAKIISGVLVFTLLIAHLVVNHMVASGGLLSYADILAYYANPLVPLMEGAFLIFVVTHALLGLRGIVLDLAPPPGVLRAVDLAMIALGGASIGYGLWLLATIAGRADT